MKTIIIPDLHNRISWVEDFLSSQEYDKVIFLADYFDDFHDTLDDIRNVAFWLKSSLYDDNRIHLLGTHDIWYRFPHNYFLEASGNTKEKSDVINNILEKKDWDLIKPFYFEQNFLISHAGVHPYLIYEYINKNQSSLEKYIAEKDLSLNTQEFIVNIIECATEEALSDASKGLSNPWLEPGKARLGIQEVGGITWLDWIIEFVPVPHLNQIVGHTEIKIPDKKITENSINYNIDTKNRYIGILEDGKFSYIKNKWMR